MTDKTYTDNIKILSFDCANKSIAFSYMRVNLLLLRAVDSVIQDGDIDAAHLVEYLCDMTEYSQSTRLEHIKYAMRGKIIDHIDGGSQDLMPDKKARDTSLQYRTFALHKWLNDTFSDIDPGTIVLIENQNRGTTSGGLGNIMSATVQDQLCYHFIMKHRVEIVAPALKNKFFTCDELRMKNIVPRHKKKYNANKEHSKMNMIDYYRAVGIPDYYNRINPDHMSDHGDSLLQAIMWFVTNKREFIK